MSDIYAPVSGTIVEVNDALADHPELLNERSLRRGLDLRDRAGRRRRSSTALLDAAGYRALIEG